MINADDYVILKQLSEGDDIKFANNLYEHYYYMVDKFYDKNNGVIPKENLEKILIEAISKYINKDYFNCNPSSYIHNCFVNYMKKHLNKLRKDSWNSLIDKAFNKDINARKEIFNSYIEAMDIRAINLYSKGNSLIELDDIKQMIYLEMWKFINNYFDSDNKDNYLSTRFDTYLNKLCGRISCSITNSNEASSLDNICYKDSYFVNSIENSDILDYISSKLNNKEKLILSYLRQGYTYEYAAKQLGLKKQSVGEMNRKIKNLIKIKGIKW